MKDFIWDFDGTLYDTYPGMVASFVAAFEENGIVVDGRDVYRKMRKYSVGRTFKEYFLDISEELQQRVKASYRICEDNASRNAQPFADVEEVCQKITSSGGRNFLLTHRDKSSLKLLKKDGLFSLFTGFVTSEDSFPRKPDPESLLHLCDLFSINPKEAVMIGDRVLDVEAGHNAGMQGYLFDPDNLIDESVVCDKRVVRISEII
ncbi:HAD-IA family hydrolase [Liquorilactobacillus mali]|uniref:Phosphoglycolate phosphatase n=1 Tax=Liquorilactobacillus mali TaxID=1618 RepID=A0A0R2FS07_9LACO|nr:HAD-IA family hydrolase [Liquorilactobacillus mali]KRN30411.1 phosphoglycolate phosphatase [Liquorilactobacillus mali]MDN7144644.1 HAD-IA family hydrolase [Liquorilactobacillus mali]